MRKPHLRLWPPPVSVRVSWHREYLSTAFVIVGWSSSFVGGGLRLWAVVSVCGRRSSFVSGGPRLWAVVFVCERSALS
jgi:hypothetical protein